MDAQTRLLLDKDEIRDLVILYAHRIVTHDGRGIADMSPREPGRDQE